jgi:dTDP-4-amino-4,6-dideoxygalactose transaminase
VAQLETALAELAEVNYAIGVASGLSALRLSLLGLGVKSGDRVLVPAYSCVALANAVLACGATPVPVDITPDDWNINPTEVKEAISKWHPRVMIAVNTFGSPASVEEMLDWNTPIIEDCAHAFGIRVNSKPLGGRTHAAMLSLYATKLIGAGEGGAVLTNSSDLAGFVRAWRDYGDQPPDGTRLNDKMTDLEASLALCQLDRLKDMLAARQELATVYHKLLSCEADRTGAFRLPDIFRPRVWYRYTVEMKQVSAKWMVNRLRYYGVHAALPITDWRSKDAPFCPVADRAYHSVVSLPLYPTLTDQEQQRVTETFLWVCRESPDEEHRGS